MKLATWITLAAGMAVAAGTGFVMVDRQQDNNIPEAQLFSLVEADCVFCHGREGVSQNPLWPALAGQQEAYLAGQLEQFAKGNKGYRRSPESAQMYNIAANLTAIERSELAAYYARQEHRRVSPSPGNRNNNGKQIYDNGPDDEPAWACVSCHGQNGEGIADMEAPALAGQHTRYLIHQLEAYKSGQREDPTGSMGMISTALSPADMQSVSLFLETISTGDTSGHESE